jgi:hypothetical protein
LLILQPVTEPRAPLWEVKDDYNVLWMGDKVGRICLNLERFEGREYGGTRQAAMAALRTAWDQIEISRVS